MRTKSGQASVELLSILAVALLVVFTFSVLSLNTLSDVEAQQSINDARNSVQALADAADQVYLQGSGASQVVYITIPSEAEFGENLTYIGKPANAPANSEPKLISMYLGGNDISASTKARLTGSFPLQAGSYNMKVLSQGSTVSIQPNLIEVDRAALAVTMSNDEMRTMKLRVFKAANENVSVEVYNNWGHTQVTFSTDPSSFDANVTGSNITLVFTAHGADAKGAYNSNLMLSATGQLSGAKETVEIPISVNVPAASP